MRPEESKPVLKVILTNNEIKIGWRRSLAPTYKSPYLCHVFVCTNDRKGARKSCADGNSGEVRRLLKEEVANRGWKKQIRISQAGCLGVCEDGPNVMLYPQKEWFSGVREDDVPDILHHLEQIIKNPAAV